MNKVASPIKRALISVSDKTNLIAFAKKLVEANITLYSSAGTYKALKAENIPVLTVTELTGAAEILDGRVKTLHPKIHGAILMKRNNPEHVATIKKLNIQPLDLVVINLYPFEAVSRDLDHNSALSSTNESKHEKANKKEPKTEADNSLAKALEMIDIGGPTLLRAAAKNFPFVTVVCDPNDYNAVAYEIETTGTTSQSMREKLAVKAFKVTTHYDKIIASRLEAKFRYGTFTASHSQHPLKHPYEASNHYSSPTSHKENASKSKSARAHHNLTSYKLESAELEQEVVPAENALSLRYGENPHQQAILKVAPPSSQEAFSLAQVKILRGAALSYNNLLDLEAAISVVRDVYFTSGQKFQAITAIIKHGTPCGLGSAAKLSDATSAALEGDIVSRYGSVIAVTQEMDEASALALKKVFVEIVIAPAYSKAALEILARKNKRMRLLVLAGMTAQRRLTDTLEKRHLESATLFQSRNEELFSQRRVVTSQATTNTLAAAPLPQKPSDFLSSVQLSSSSSSSLSTEEIKNAEREGLAASKNITSNERVLDYGLIDFTNIAVKHIKSNAIAIAMAHDFGTGGYMLIGVGAGQPNRLDAVQKLAIPKMIENLNRLFSTKDQIATVLANVVLASDAFFPFADSLVPIYENGIKIVVQPGGSIRDHEVISEANRLGITMIFTDRRHFLH
ncbi:bifunctional purine biosynthesis protein PurH [Spirochaetota bacterium]|nr:bifunctional purine biosynthesis protein PurH [Spirochaetota bacterium]